MLDMKLSDQALAKTTRCQTWGGHAIDLLPYKKQKTGPESSTYQEKSMSARPPRSKLLLSSRISEIMPSPHVCSFGMSLRRGGNFRRICAGGMMVVCGRLPSERQNSLPVRGPGPHSARSSFTSPTLLRLTGQLSTYLNR